MRRESPGSREEAASLLAECAADRASVRIAGAATKRRWGAPAAEADVELSTLALDALVEHNAGDLTAVIEAGVRLGDAQERFASAGQMLALDPPGADATLGGVLATADSGPLRHRYGAPRDLVLGMCVALSDGSLARSGGRVIKNVAGYDLGKLVCGSYGTLGAIVEVAVRLHPLPRATATAVGRARDAALVAGASRRLAHAPLEAIALDLRWDGREGAVLARFSGAGADAAARELAAGGLDAEVVEGDDEPLWEAQRAAQRAAGGTVLRVSAVQAGLERVLEAAGAAGGTLVGRAALALCWVTLPDPSAVDGLRAALAPWPCAVLDAPAGAEVDRFGPSPAAPLMRRVRERFDPSGILGPGALAGVA